MQLVIHMSRLFSAFLCLLLAFPTAIAQQLPSERKDDLIRITTDLVQTDVTVLDKQGRFLEGLQLEQFELLVDGKPQNISFFEQVTAGSRREAVLVTASGATRPTPEKDKAPTDPGPSVVRLSSCNLAVSETCSRPPSGALRRAR